MKPRRAPAVRLYGIIDTHEAAATTIPHGVRLLSFRALSAVVVDVPSGKREPEAPNTVFHRSIVAALFARQSVVPLPPGVVFRRADTLVNWLDLHYAGLRDALRYVDGRAEARVHVRPASSQGELAERTAVAEPESGFTTSALEILHELGRDVTAWMPAPHVTTGRAAFSAPQPVTTSTVVQTAQAAGLGRAPGADRGRGRDLADISASFLVERSHWREFAEAVAAEAQQAPGLAISLTGPWPPYDFVRLQFGG
jgi:hypothetical protein